MVPKISTSSVPAGKSNSKVRISELFTISSRSTKSPSAITKNSSSSPANFESKNVLSKVISKVPVAPVTSTSSKSSISSVSASMDLISTPSASYGISTTVPSTST